MPAFYNLGDKITTDFAYICREGSNEELRYSIRSVSESFPDANIWVVGGRPDWYTGNHIQTLQNDDKYSNAIENLYAICNSKDISDSFVLMNDDFYIVKNIDSVLSYHGGLLSEKVDQYQRINPNSNYTRKLAATYKKIRSIGIEKPLDYELHVPMVMEKENLRKSLSYGKNLLWRSIYGNLFDVGGEKMEDVKVYVKGPLVLKSYNLNKDSHTYLSSADSSFDLILKDILIHKFNKKSKHEK
jgi:hypothetical protein